MPQPNTWITIGRLIAICLLALLVAACGPELPGSAISLQSPIKTPTARPRPTRTPPRATPTSPRTTPTPPGVTPTPLRGTPTALPTVPGPLPPGPKLVYARLIDEGVFSFWAASVANPSLRKMLTTADPARFGAHAALSHDGSQLAYVFTNSTKRWNAELWTAGIDGRERRQLATGVHSGRWINYPLWSPDDRYLAVVQTQYETSPQVNPFPYTQTIAMINAATGEKTSLVQSTIPRYEDELLLYIWPLDWSTDGRYFFYQKGAAGHVELWRVAVSTLESEYVATISDLGAPRCYFLSPDGQWVLCTVQITDEPQQYAVIRVPTEGGETEIIVSGASDGQYNPVWGLSGDEVTFNFLSQANQQAELRTINMRSSQGRTLASSERGAFTPLAWSPDGQWLATAEYPIRSVLLIAQDGVHVVRMEDVGPFIGWLDGELSSQQH